MVDDIAEKTELSLPGDTIFKRHIATRASNKRKVIIYAVCDLEWEGYTIGIENGSLEKNFEDASLQIIELPSGVVTTVRTKHVIAVEDSTPFYDLSPVEKDEVDKRTSSFRKISQTWLQTNWPDLYDRREENAWNSRQGLGRRNSRQVSSRDGRTQSSSVYPGDVQGKVRVPDSYGPSGDGSL